MAREGIFRKELQHGLIASLFCLFLLSNFFYHSNHSLHTFETKWNIKGSVGLFLDRAHVPHIAHLFVRNTNCILTLFYSLAIMKYANQKQRGKKDIRFLFLLHSVLQHNQLDNILTFLIIFFFLFFFFSSCKATQLNLNPIVNIYLVSLYIFPWLRLEEINMDAPQL